MAVIRWARQQDYRTVSHLATSFGASVTLLAASTYDLSLFKKVVFWNPVINYRNTFIEAKVEWGKEFFNQKKIDELAYRPCTQIPETDFSISAKMTQELLLMRPETTVWPKSQPLLIVQGDADSLVPFEDARAYAQAHRPHVKFVCLKGVDHGFNHRLIEAMKLTKDWLMEKV